MLAHITPRRQIFVRDDYFPPIGTVYEWRPLSWWEAITVEFRLLGAWFRYLTRS